MPKISDFGLSGHIPEKAVMEATLDPGGLPSYWAPEVETGRYDKSADVYSVGLIAFEMLMQRCPRRPEEGNQPTKLESLKCT